MDDRRRLPPDGGGEHVRERIRRDAGDPVTSTRAAKEDVSGVPRKVPRFQYVDFPSLHQCIKQLSVPPLEGWLASCPLAGAPTSQPSGPKEGAPKFKYVDYPSLYHCIQQLSVPPLEIWSSGLARPSLEGQSPSQALGYRTGSGQAKPAAELQGDTPPGMGSETGRAIRSVPGRTSRTHSAPRSECSSRDESGSSTHLEGVGRGDENAHRPSVISMAHGIRRKRSAMPPADRAGWVEQQEATDPTAHWHQQVNEESLHPSVGRMLTESEELWSQRHIHKDQTPH